MDNRIARELGKKGITVNAYAPGAVDTRMRQSFFHLQHVFLV
jgi:NAD(P)-dependent dehydrogenase (short-subunit alcohol dehydrogenase family)